jgi:hypothetical protein
VLSAEWHEFYSFRTQSGAKRMHYIKHITPKVLQTFMWLLSLLFRTFCAAVKRDFRLKNSEMCSYITLIYSCTPIADNGWRNCRSEEPQSREKCSNDSTDCRVDTVAFKLLTSFRDNANKAEFRDTPLALLLLFWTSPMWLLAKKLDTFNKVFLIFSRFYRHMPLSFTFHFASYATWHL